MGGSAKEPIKHVKRKNNLREKGCAAPYGDNKN